MARAFRNGVGSISVAHREFVKHAAMGATVLYASPYDQKYTGGGPSCLVNGLTGGLSFTDGTWQGFRRNDLEATIDLGDTLEVSEIESGFLQDQHSWIFFPGTVQYSVSLDGKSFTLAATVQNNMPDSTATAIRKTFAASLRGAPARFIRVKATNIGRCPPWHPGKGEDAWLFVDEVLVK
jgi:hypothetical protein